MARSISKKYVYLRENGPICEVVLKLSFPTVEALCLEKKDVPFVKVNALIDTGAQTTAVSRKVADKLKLVPRGKAKVYTSQSNKIVNEYDICLEFDSDVYINTLRVLGADLENHNIDCLIGRDVLQWGVFTYDGPKKEFTFSF